MDRMLFPVLRVLARVTALLYRWRVMDLAHFSRLLAIRLLWWSVASIGIGSGLMLVPPPLIEGIGLQMIVWGSIDAVIALFGLQKAKRLFSESPEEHRVVRDALRLRRVLVVNGRLDILYIVAGVAIVVIFRRDPFLLGNGIGILIQSSFLLLFDWYYAARLPSRSPAWYDSAP